MGASHPLELLTERDLPQIAAIEAAVFPEPFDPAALRRRFYEDTCLYVGIHVGDVLAAYFGFIVTPPTAHVIANATHPDFRRRGYGRRVLAEAEGLARKAGARWFLGEVRTSNRAQRLLLGRIGWWDCGRCPHFFENGEDARIVIRVFPSAVEPR